MRRDLTAVATFTMLLSALVPTSTAQCSDFRRLLHGRQAFAVHVERVVSGDNRWVVELPTLPVVTPQQSRGRDPAGNLIFCYGENLLVDGNFGSNTAATARRIQAREGLVVDGWHGNNTRDRM